MALTISIKDDPETNPIFFDCDDPLYWFLYPYFEETYREVGQMVDLYGDAEFFAEELLAFFLVLGKRSAMQDPAIMHGRLPLGFSAQIEGLLKGC